MLEVITVALVSSVVLVPVADAISTRRTRKARGQLRLGKKLTGDLFCMNSGTFKV